MLLAPVAPRPRAARLVSFVALALGAAVPAAAQITIGTPEPGGGLCLPFGCDASRTTRYQQVYAASAFAGPIAIGALTFHHTQFAPGAGLFAPGTYTLSLSVTPRGPGTLTEAFDANVGGPAHHFATLTLSGSAAAPTFTVVGTPFRYDPALGHLLADWHIAGTGHIPLSPFETTYFDADYAGVVTSSAWNTEWVPGLIGSELDGVGLVTTFGPAVSTVPEPATVVLLTGGVLPIGGVARRRRGR
jgi:hypothetical protein